MRAARHDPTGGDQASRSPRGGESDRRAMERSGEAALHQSRTHQRDRRTVDRQIRARAIARALGPQEEPRKGRQMSEKFVYVTYIRTTQEKVWEALTKPEFTRKFWYGTALESAWSSGAPWKMVNSEGTITDEGEVLEIEKPTHLVLGW